MGLWQETLKTEGALQMKAKEKWQNIESLHAHITRARLNACEVGVLRRTMLQTSYARNSGNAIMLWSLMCDGHIINAQVCNAT